MVVIPLMKLSHAIPPQLVPNLLCLTAVCPKPSILASIALRDLKRDYKKKEEEPKLIKNYNKTFFFISMSNKLWCLIF